MTMTLDDLQTFCSKDDFRHSIVHPFTQGEWTYATDGRILVRVPAIDGAPIQGDPRNCGALVDDASGCNRVAEFPPNWEAIEIKRENCSECNGYGKLGKCPECEGHGTVECFECGHESDCDKCDGVGTWGSDVGKHCEDCDGKGTRDAQTPAALNHGELYADLRFLRLIATLPNWTLYWEHPNKALRFLFDGGEGILMPLRQKDYGIVKEQWTEAIA